MVQFLLIFSKFSVITDAILILCKKINAVSVLAIYSRTGVRQLSYVRRS